MSNPAEGADKSADTQYQTAENTYAGNYNSAMGNYNSQLSKMQGEGNPYESQSYKTEQNQVTSGAMNAENTQAKQQLQDAALRTGTNTASLGATVASNARAGQRQMDTYNAGQDAANQDKYLSWEQGLAGDQLAGANSEENMYGQQVTGRSNALTNYTNAADAQDAMWGQMVAGAAQGAGAGIGAAMA